MREILFRGKRADNSEWIEGFYAKSGDKTFILIDNDIAFGYVTMKEVVSESLGQFTGLYDKDGKKIFEGDIVLVPWGEKKIPSCIEYVPGEFYATPKEETEDIWSVRIAPYNSVFEIIGNIHDNPELLEG